MDDGRSSLCYDGLHKLCKTTFCVCVCHRVRESQPEQSPRREQR